jgi:hypothetical protein
MKPSAAAALRGRDDLFARGVAAAERDVVGDRLVEQDRLLGHQRDVIAQGGERHVADVLAVDGDRPASTS